MSLRPVGLLPLLLVAVAVVAAAEDATSTNSSSVPSTTAPEKSGRLIDERLMPPRATDFAPWNRRLTLVGDTYAPPRVTEELDVNDADKAVPKRTVGPAPEAASCCGPKPLAPNNFLPSDKDKQPLQQQQQQQNQQHQQQQKLKQSFEAAELERGSGNNTPPSAAPRYHGNRPSDERYGHGWRSSSYLGFGKEKGYYDQRSHYPYDRYSETQRPLSSNYAVDGDRFGGAQRPSPTYGTESDRYSSSSNSRPNNYQSANYFAGAFADRPRPLGGSYGISGSLGSEPGEADYPFTDAAGPVNGMSTNLQTQKAVALKALAGVALIGAAAALASNPVLLPISVISGRRKRAAEVHSDNYALTALLQGYLHPKPNEVADSSDGSPNRSGPRSASQKLVISPQCVARLACHVHRDYLEELDKSRAQLLSVESAISTANETSQAVFDDLQHWFDRLIHSNILVADYFSNELKTLIRSAVTVGSNKNASCDKFSCLIVHDTNKEKTT